MPRRLIIGVVGGNKLNGAVERHIVESARECGGAIVRKGALLLTGSWPGPVGKPEVKRAAMLGAIEAMPGPGDPARIVGIIPKGEIVGQAWAAEAMARQWMINTSLSSAGRNPINGMTPDLVIAFPGGKGTASEVAFALAAERKVFYAPSDLLLRAAVGAESAALVEDLESGVDGCRQIGLSNRNVVRLDNLLKDGLSNWDDVVEQLIKESSPNGRAYGIEIPSGFPDRVPTETSRVTKDDFETWLQRMS